MRADECPEHIPYRERRWVWRGLLPQRVEVLCCRRCEMAVLLTPLRGTT